MSLWRIHRGSHALATADDSITINVPAGRFLRIISAKVVGMASAAAAGAELGIFRVTTVGSGGSPTSLPVKNLDPNGASAPSGFSAVYGYTTDPTIETDAMIRLGFQPFGGQDREVAVPGAEVEFWDDVAYQVSVRSISGTPNALIELVVELK
jgi:hypothetical protein